MLGKTIKNTIIAAIVGQSSNLSVSQAWIGLSSTAPNADGTNVTEPSGNGYGRVCIGQSGQSVTYKFATPVDGSTKNTSEIYFPESTGSWGPALTHFVIFSAKTGGTMIAADSLKEEGVATPVTVNQAKTVVMFRPEKLVITLAD